MNRRLTCWLFLCLALPASAAQLGFSARSMEAPGWRAEGVALEYDPRGALQLQLRQLTLQGKAPLRALKLRCQALQTEQGVRCEQAPFSVTLPNGERLSGNLRAHYRHAQHWQAEVQAPTRGLQLTLRQDDQALQVSLRLQRQSAATLLALANAVGLPLPGEASAGHLSATMHATLGAQLKLKAEVQSEQLTYNDPSGRYASERLSAQATLNWDGAQRRGQLSLRSRGGQAYADPVFLDFDALPLQADATLLGQAMGWKLAPAHLRWGTAGDLRLQGTLGADYLPQDLDVQVEASDFSPLVNTGVQPFLIGTPLEGFTASGRGKLQAQLRKGAPARVQATLEGASLAAARMGLSLQGLSGTLDWSAEENNADSKLRWDSGTAWQVPLGPSSLHFQARGRGFTLKTPWRQPLLQGALRVERLALAGLGQQLQADFEGALEPLDLAALCRALGWPEFGGTLSGRLPGLSVRDDLWSVDGTLEAQAFDGTLKVRNLRALQPLGALPRVSADIELRRLDLERLTQTFSFGRITGRLDGDVKDLRLLNWNPVAFDARLYSTPGDRTSKRISQRAIDNISAIGGGPTGVVSRGFLSVFEDFAYAGLGLHCVLRDGVCRMDGIEPAGSNRGQKGYYLVKGRLLPRIDVVGYAERVSWNNLVEQLKAARASAGPQTQP